MKTSLDVAPSALEAPRAKLSIRVDPATDQRYLAVAQKGRALLLDPHTNKGTASRRSSRTPRSPTRR